MIRFRMTSLSIPRPGPVCVVAKKSAVIALCALVALCLAVPMPVFLSQPAHAKSAASADHLNFNGRHTHLLVPVGSPPNEDPPGSVAPVPIPGGDVAPPVGFLHAFFPGPTSIGDDGVDVEPSVITNFRGFIAVAMLLGTAKDANGHSFTLMTDIRVHQGEYVSADGRHHRGTFVLI